ncbi:MAG: hypothetical protein MUE55_00045 [Thermoplasmata archaeon]|jgi:hypothetical protein|nr:hypothetical protein [Thermoplasmata archaeon]
MGAPQDQDYTKDELAFLSELRRREGRTCRHCSWLSVRGNQRGCFPQGKYRKFLSNAEYESGCLQFVSRDSAKAP